MSKSGMRLAARIAAAAVAVSTAASLASVAEARCARLAFSVNDYGKDGPTKDAKALLDKHIATWTATRGIKKYTTGKKDVSCELFLDFGVFDEHTCKASATVCWADGQTASPAKAGAGASGAPSGATSASGPARTTPKAAPAQAPAAPAKPKAKSA
ncbi:MAG: hypothetical protein AB7F78_26065 [Hyphomicrobiaceae bacterium]